MSSIAAGASCATVGERFEGQAFSRSDGRLVYRESHWRYQEGDAAWHLVLYSCADGTPFARKLLRESPDAESPDFDFVDARDGYREGVRTQGAGREVYVQADARTKLDAKALVVPPGAVIDAGFDAFVRNHWPALSRGEPVTVSFLVPSRQDYLTFKIDSARDAVIDGRPVHQWRMGLVAWYGFALPSLELAYERENGRLVEFKGIGTLRNAQGRPWDVRIVFPAAQRTGSPSVAEIARARAVPLNPRPCVGDAS